jgi:hypothetical protein
MGTGFNDLDVASALHDLDGPGEDWERQVARAYSVFGVDPLKSTEDDPFVLYGDPFEGADELGLFGLPNLPELDPDFLRAKAKEQLRDIKGRFREMRAKLGIGKKEKRADLNNDVDAFLDKLGHPMVDVLPEKGDWKRDRNGQIIVPDEFVKEAYEDPDLPSTMAMHFEDSVDEDGNPVKVLTKERELQGMQWFNKAIDGVPKPEGRPPRSWSLGGGQGSGKSTVAKSGILPGFPETRELGDWGTDKPPGNAVLIEADGIKMQMDEFGDYPITQAGSVTHVESTFWAKMFHERATELGYDTLLDGMGDSKATKLKTKADKTRSLGATDVDGVYVGVPTEEAMARVVVRAFQTGRIVHPDRVVPGHASVSRILEDARSDESGIYDNFNMYYADVPFGDPPIQVVKDREIINPELWQEVLKNDSKQLIPTLEAALARLRDPNRDFPARKVKNEATGEMEVMWTPEEVRALSIQYVTSILRVARKKQEQAAKEAQA